METIHATTQFRWGHEYIEGAQMVEPDPDTFVEYKGPDGESVIQDDGTPLMIPPPGFQPEYEKVQLDTMVIIESDSAGNANVFKFSLNPADLARFLSYYVQFLDTEGRQLLRETLAQTSDIVPASVADLRHLELVKS